MRESEGLPPIVRKLVMEKLAEYARTHNANAGGPASQGSLRDMGQPLQGEGPPDGSSNLGPISEPFEPT
jgi:uncharacterized protein (DUF2345 family)